jgi:hypothetical protein
MAVAEAQYANFTAKGHRGQRLFHVEPHRLSDMFHVELLANAKARENLSQQRVGRDLPGDLSQRFLAKSKIFRIEFKGLRIGSCVQ